MNPIEEMVARFRERFETSEKSQEFVAAIKKAEEEKAAKAAMFRERFEALRAKMAEAAAAKAEEVVEPVAEPEVTE